MQKKTIWLIVITLIATGVAILALCWLQQKNEPAAETFVVYPPDEIALIPLDQDLVDFDSPRQYRLVYYNIPGVFENLVSLDEFNLWIENESTSDEMLLVQFIKKFNIPKEQCEVVCKQEQQINIEVGNDIKSEMFETPNLDIIYTFDNEIINRYYSRYENIIYRIYEVKDFIERMGWENVTIDTNIIQGQISGKYNNPITIIVSIKVPGGAVESVRYVSEGGREMDSDKILHAGDEDLWNYMYSY